MITVGMNYEVVKGKQDEFEKVFAKVLEIMKAMKGHAESHLYKDVAKPNAYLIVSEWSDDAAFDAFTRSERFKNVVELGRERILASRPRHQIYGRGNAGSCPLSAE